MRLAEDDLRFSNPPDWPNSGIGGDVANAVDLLVGVAAERCLSTDEDAPKAGEDPAATGGCGVPMLTDGEWREACWPFDVVERDRCRAPKDNGRLDFGSMMMFYA